ncbi:MAG: site-2 protease family protein [Ruminococcus sp.]|nr:site-2 protease family protein [Ruminococcus sp.]
MLSVILNGIRSGSLDFYSVVAQIVAVLLIIFLILPLREWAKAFTASLLGDKGIKNRGRLSLNPFNHIDPIGAMCMLFFGFGWSKPVPIDSRYFKNPKIGMAISSLAGPLANIIAAFAGLLVFNLIAVIDVTFYFTVIGSFIRVFLSFYVTLNIQLAVFNLIPIPPLDGSKILFAFLPDDIVMMFYRYQNVFFIALFAALYMGLFNGLLGWANSGLLGFLEWLANLPFIPFS